MKKLLLLLLSINLCVNAMDIDYIQPQETIAKSSDSDINSCWYKAESKYGVPAKLLYAIAKVESRFNPRVTAINKNGSEDIGLMQINSYWLPKLSKYGISRDDLFDPCINIQVGAWIMASNIKQLGYNWNAVGAYNAVSENKRGIYAKKIHKAILELGFNN